MLQIQNDETATGTANKVAGSLEFYNGPNREHYVRGDTVSKLTLGASNTDCLYIDDSYVAPADDNTSFSLGTASLRWTTVYAGTGTINTSDANEKQQVECVTEAEKRVALTLKGMIKRFKFNDAVAKKGDNARIHFGVIAQDVKAAFEAEGLNAHAYSIFCSDTWWQDADGNCYNETQKDAVEGNLTEHTRLGIRYEELLALVISAI